MTGRGRARGRAQVTDSSVTSPGGLKAREQSDPSENSSDTNLSTTTTNNTPASPSSPSKESTATLSVDDIQSILQDSRTYSDQYDVKKVLILAQNFVRTEKDVKTVACSIYQKCMEDTSLAKRGAEICDHLTGIEVGNVKFRNCLLSMVQSDYKIRSEIYESSPQHYNGFMAFLCEIFNVMRTASGEIFKPLIGPIFDSFGLVLGVKGDNVEGQGDGDEDGLDSRDVDGLDDDSCDILSYHLQYVGKLLEQHEEARMKSLINRVRTCIIHSRSSPRARCSLLEVLEAYSRSWEAAPNETTKYYCDMSVDIISGLVL